MKTYIFNTVATMKEYNNKKWWIDSGIIGEIKLTAANVRDALQQYKKIVTDKYYIDISNNALKNKKPMFVDTVAGDALQVGYVLTAKCDFEDSDDYKWSQQYIDLWVTILTVIDTDFE